MGGPLLARLLIVFCSLGVSPPSSPGCDPRPELGMGPPLPLLCAVSYVPGYSSLPDVYAMSVARERRDYVRFCFPGSPGERGGHLGVLTASQQRTLTLVLKSLPLTAIAIRNAFFKKPACLRVRLRFLSPVGTDYTDVLELGPGLHAAIGQVGRKAGDDVSMLVSVPRGSICIHLP